MPLLDRHRDRPSLPARALPARGAAVTPPWPLPAPSRAAAAARFLFPACENPGCRGRRFLPLSRRARELPRFEGRAICSRDCLRDMVGAALRREAQGAEPAQDAYRHRMPVGLLLLSRRAVTRAQLRGALEAQRAAGQGRLGEWLVRTQGVAEETVAAALAVQWGVPVLALGGPPAGPPGQDACTAGLLPRLFVEAFGVLPARVAAGRLLYLAVEGPMDRCLQRAVESMTGLRVEPGVMKASDHAGLRRRALDSAGPAARLFRAASSQGLEHSIAALIAGSAAVSARLARVREYIWVRLEGAGSVPGAPLAIQDAIFTLSSASRD